mgnify:CR=1 FL=1
MKVIVSSDEYCSLIPRILQEIEKAGHAGHYAGPGPGEEQDWPDVTARAVKRVIAKEFDEAVVLCWTGTGATLAANKVRGIRAALCNDAETARGARIWNHANVLALSIRKTSDPMVREILSAWYGTPFSEDDWNLKQIDHIRSLEAQFDIP